MPYSIFSAKKLLVLVFAFLFFFLINACNNKNTSDAKSGGTNVSQNTDSLFKKYNLDKIKLPAGFKADVYAEVPKARSMCVSPNGTINLIK